MFRLIQKFILLCALAFASHTAIAGSAIYIDDDSGTVAVSGYDAVAYFTDKMPVKGSAAISAQHDGATYYFASTANRDAFVATPARFVPQYGGYCAYAASLGKKAPGNPKYWTVVDDKLYLNYNASVQKQWLADVPKFIERADKIWHDIKND